VIAGYIGYSELASARIARGDCLEHHELLASRLRAFLASWAVQPRPRRLCAPTRAVTRWWDVQLGRRGDALITPREGRPLSGHSQTSGASRSGPRGLDLELLG
jgi:hypothetical protein